MFKKKAKKEEPVLKIAYDGDKILDRPNIDVETLENAAFEYAPPDPPENDPQSLQEPLSGVSRPTLTEDEAKVLEALDGLLVSLYRNSSGVDVRETIQAARGILGRLVQECRS